MYDGMFDDGYYDGESVVDDRNSGKRRGV